MLPVLVLFASFPPPMSFPVTLTASSHQQKGRVRWSPRTVAEVRLASPWIPTSQKPVAHPRGQSSCPWLSLVTLWGAPGERTHLPCSPWRWAGDLRGSLGSSCFCSFSRKGHLGPLSSQPENPIGQSCVLEAGVTAGFQGLQERDPWPWASGPSSLLLSDATR